MKHVRFPLLASFALLLTMAVPASAAERVTIDNFRDLGVLHEAIDLEDIDYLRLEAAVFLVTNEQRHRRGLPMVRFHEALADAARGHANRMVEFDFYDHTDPTSRAFATPQDRARRAGIRNPAIAENIHNTVAIQYNGGWVYSRGGRGRFSNSQNGSEIPAHTYLSFADSVVADWMNSPGHRANILHKEARELGIGAQFFWKGDWPQLKVVQNFQLFRDVAASPSTRQPTPPSIDRDARPEPSYDDDGYGDDDGYSDDGYSDDGYDDDGYSDDDNYEPEPRRRNPRNQRRGTSCPYRDTV